MSSAPKYEFSPTLSMLLLFAGIWIGSPHSGSGSEFFFKDFSDTSRLKVNGDARAVATSDGSVLRVVGAKSRQAGSVFSLLPIRAATFSARFTVRISTPGGIVDPTGSQGADGVAFVVQSLTNSIGAQGGGIGYGGVTNSVAVELDTFQNPAGFDPNSNHIGINLNGDTTHGIGSPYTAPVVPNFDDGNKWFVWVDYDGKDLAVRANQSGLRPPFALLSRPVDLPSLLGQEQGFVGFTAATGDAWENVDILSFEYRDAYQPILTTNQVAATIVAGVQVAWASVTNRPYQVQASQAITSNTWFDVGAPILGNGTTNAFFDPLGANHQRYYRVLTAP